MSAAPDVESALAGCMLHADAATAADLLGLIADGEVADPKARQVVTLARLLVAEDVAPAPAAVLAAAGRSEPDPRRLAALGTYVADCYGAAPAAGSGSWYAKRVREAAFRRAVLATADRLSQAATGLGHDVLTDVTKAERDRLRTALERVTS